MSQTDHNSGEVDDLGPLFSFADVIRRQGLRFERQNRKARAALAALPGIESEQNVRRYGPLTTGGVGGEIPRGRSLHEGFRHWPYEMQMDYLTVFLRGSGLTFQVERAAGGEGTVRGDIMRDVMQHQDQASSLTRLVYEASVDGIDPGEASNIVAATEQNISTLRQVASKALFASTNRPVIGHGGR